MKDVHYLTTIESVRCLAHPLRLQIIRLLNDKPMSPKMVALRLEQKPTKLYYHFDELKAHGIIELVREERRGNLIERFYEPVAALIRFAPELLRSTDALDDVMFESMLSTVDTVRSDLGQLNKQVRTGRILFQHRKVTLTQPRAKAFWQALDALVAEYSEDDEEDAISYCFSPFFYPLPQNIDSDEE